MQRLDLPDAASPCGVMQLITALETYYPRLSGHMGYSAFQHAAVWHIERHTPQIRSMADYAGDFVHTLAALYPDSPALQELAWIERALDDAQLAPASPAVSPARLLNVDWSQVSLRFSPTLRTARASTNAAAIWRALDADAETPESRLLDQAGGFLVWRSGGEGVLCQVDMLEYMAVLHVQANGSFASLCALLARWLEGSGLLRASSLLAGWTHSGLLASLETRPLALSAPPRGARAAAQGRRPGADCAHPGGR